MVAAKVIAGRLIWYRKYQKHTHKFLAPERYRTAHIVKHVTEQQSEEQAEAGIAVALAELERGAPFPEVAPPPFRLPRPGRRTAEFTIPGEMVEEFRGSHPRARA
jgi:hypothetical protein